MFRRMRSDWDSLDFSAPAKSFGRVAELCELSLALGLAARFGFGLADCPGAGVGLSGTS